jgi:hypothetical protein
LQPGRVEAEVKENCRSAPNLTSSSRMGRLVTRPEIKIG